MPEPRRSEDDLREDLQNIHTLLSEPAFKWFLGKAIAMREASANTALRRHDTIQDTHYYLGRVQGNDDLIQLLERESKHIQAELKVYAR